MSQALLGGGPERSSVDTQGTPRLAQASSTRRSSLCYSLSRTTHQPGWGLAIENTERTGGGRYAEQPPSRGWDPTVDRFVFTQMYSYLDDIQQHGLGFIYYLYRSNRDRGYFTDMRSLNISFHMHIYFDTTLRDGSCPIRSHPCTGA